MSASASKPNAAREPLAAPEAGAPPTAASREPLSTNDAPAETANPPNYRWNFSVLALDAALFSVAMSFVGTTTVFPSLLVRLNASEVLVGAASGLMSGAWLLPQLFVAGAVARMPYKKPIIIWGAWLSRPLFAVMALVIWLYAVSRPSLTLAIVLLCFTTFWVMDAVVSIPWYEIIGKTIPPRRRGRMLGLSQILGAVGGIGAGIVVRYILSENSRWAFPANYAILFIFACVAFLIAATMLTIIREPASTSLAKERPTTRQVLALLASHPVGRPPLSPDDHGAPLCGVCIHGQRFLCAVCHARAWL